MTETMVKIIIWGMIALCFCVLGLFGAIDLRFREMEKRLQNVEDLESSRLNEKLTEREEKENVFEDIEGGERKGRK